MLYREIHLSDFEDISRISDLIANVFNTLKRRKKTVIRHVFAIC
jgi:hypothetical protein